MDELDQELLEEAGLKDLQNKNEQEETKVDDNSEEKRRKKKKHRKHRRDRSRERRHRKRDKKRRRRHRSRSRSRSYSSRSYQRDRRSHRNRHKDRNDDKNQDRHSTKHQEKQKSNKSRSRSNSKQNKQQEHQQSDRKKVRNQYEDKRLDQKRQDRSDRFGKHDRRDRDRDRKQKSRSRSKDKNQQRQRFKFDSPPKEDKSISDMSHSEALQLMKQLQMIPGMQNLSPADLMKLIQSQNVYNKMQSSRADRKLYIGNLPKNITPLMLVNILNQALKKMAINTEPEGNSILNSWISADGNYAFVEFRTPQEATNGFALNNVTIFGQPLKVGRPRTYTAQQNNQVSPIQQLIERLGAAGSLKKLLTGDQEVVSKEEKAKIKDSKVTAQLPTRILILKNMIKIPILEIDEEYDDILRDIKEECENFGKVVKVVIPRPQKGVDHKEIPGLGKVFVEFESIESSKKAREELTKKLFDEQIVEGSYLSPEAFAKGELDNDK